MWLGYDSFSRSQRFLKKNPSDSCGIILCVIVQKGPITPKTTHTVFIVPYHSPELDGKILLLKTLHIWIWDTYFTEKWQWNWAGSCLAASQFSWRWKVLYRLVWGRKGISSLSCLCIMHATVSACHTKICLLIVLVRDVNKTTFLLVLRHDSWEGINIEFYKLIKNLWLGLSQSLEGNLLLMFCQMDMCYSGLLLWW